ncbi:hypothetical protein [Longimicrobium terrae]|uniref:DUF642 domain-containing protein n=1 Tax=Longimicrobium terrae TaxID=1639882 RepID=A0A841H3W6_9BACT|nr:hypothetical protein [Longimicrobium terrae]MBB4638665.1 hypothetical protein [Longimicrobium terrae]MBB6072905.1 hypothetical protein [Longimicrobium terrae]NNC31518.1 hypothetical protein [Longimicrobium terrae]
MSSLLRRSLPLAAVLALAAGAFAGCAARDPVMLEDAFDGENGGRPALMYAGFSNWVVEGGTVDLIGARSEWDFIPGNGLYVDLDGDRPDGVTFKPGVLASRDEFALQPGVYELTFRVAGSQRGDRNTVVVTLGSVFRRSITLESGDRFGYSVHRIVVRRAQKARLRFDNAGADGYGLLLDDVRLARVR